MKVKAFIIILGIFRTANENAANAWQPDHTEICNSIDYVGNMVFWEIGR